MKYKTKKTAVLLLQDGKVFYGKAAGSIGTTTGELCFNTGMTGFSNRTISRSIGTTRIAAVLRAKSHDSVHT